MTLKEFMKETNRFMILARNNPVPIGKHCMLERDRTMSILPSEPLPEGVYVRPMVRLRDGTLMSIQASIMHYSIPKMCPASEDNVYTAMEVGFENKLQIPEWKEKYEMETWPSQGINILYGYVKAEDIEKFINEHGGIDHYEL